MEIARMIDHTLLKQDASIEAIVKLCAEAKEYHFASVCVNPGFVPLAAKELKGTDVKVCTVVGFPLGATLPESNDCTNFDICAFKFFSGKWDKAWVYAY